MLLRAEHTKDQHFHKLFKQECFQQERFQQEDAIETQVGLEAYDKQFMLLRLSINLRATHRY